MNKKYIVRLTDEERAELAELTSKGKAAVSGTLGHGSPAHPQRMKTTDK